MKMSSASYRSAMRPEYLSEFEEAGIVPPSDLMLRGQVEPLQEPVVQIQRSVTRKVILADPGTSGNVVAENLAAVLGGTLMLLLCAAKIVIIVYAAMIIGFIRASRRGSRRGL